MSRLRSQFGIPSNERVALYATQPFFWRGVITPAQLRENVQAMNAGVCSPSVPITDSP